MTRMWTRNAQRVACAGAVAVVSLALGAWMSAASRPVTWLRPVGALERDLNAQAARGLRFAAVSDGLPSCSVVVMQAPEGAGAPATYRVVSDRDLAASLARLVDQGFVPRGAVRSVGARHEVIFERTTPPRPSGEWRLIEFEKVEELQAALTAPASEGYRPVLVVRPALRSWPGLSERGMVLAVKAPGAAPLDLQIHSATRRDVSELARHVEAATSAGWRFDLLFAHPRDGGPKGRRERATVVLSQPRAAATPGTAVRIERRSSFGILGDVVVGAVAYWDEILVASVKGERRNAWATPVRLAARDVECGPLGFSFDSGAPDEQAWSITALVAKPSARSGDYDLLVVSDHNLNLR